MRYFSNGSESNREFKRHSMVDLPVFSPDPNERMARRGWLRRGNPAEQHSPALYPISVDRLPLALSTVNVLYGIEPGKSRPYPVAEGLVHAGSDIRLASYGQKDPTILKQLQADRAMLAEIFSRLQERSTARQVRLVTFMTTRSLEPYAIAVAPVSDFHAYSGTRVAPLVGLALVEVLGSQSEWPHTERTGIEPVVMSPLNGEVGLLPKNTRVSGALYESSRLLSMGGQLVNS